jgi:transcriptional regulator
MYVPAHFREDRIPVLHDAMRRIGFASLITCFEGGIEASHLPMMTSPDPGPFGTLHGHMARANPQWQRAGKNDEVLVTFLGPNTYVTPSWYPTKQQTGKVVPTWNYLAVHAYGKIEFFDDPESLRDIVTRLTEKYETPRQSPWAVTDAPADYIDTMLRAIVGFRLVICRLEGKWKMSQNRPPQDIAGVRKGLAEEADPGRIAAGDEMAAASRTPER